MGVVYESRSLPGGSSLAIKLPHRHLSSDEEIRRRLLQEALINSYLRHPNIVEIKALDEDRHCGPFLVMELVRGHSLAAHLRRQGPMNLRQAMEVLRPVASALHAIHGMGVLHRDVKPQNILLCIEQGPDGAAIRDVKLADFGMARVQDIETIPGASDQRTSPGLILGTPEYFAPEVVRAGSDQLDARADQFSLALVLYRALSSRHPFEGGSAMETLLNICTRPPSPLGQLVPGLPRHVIAAVERALSKRREDRHPSIHAFVRALEDDPPAQSAWEESAASYSLQIEIARPPHGARKRRSGTCSAAVLGLCAAIALLPGRLSRQPGAAYQPIASPSAHRQAAAICRAEAPDPRASFSRLPYVQPHRQGPPVPPLRGPIALLDLAGALPSNGVTRQGLRGLPR